MLSSYIREEFTALNIQTFVTKIMMVFMLAVRPMVSGFGGLGVACWPLVPKFAGSNPAESLGFLRAKKSSARLPSEGK
jgi:hypothetical protein